MTRVLIVDDEPNQRLLYREAFEGEGFDVVEAGDSGQAVSLVTQARPDLVVLDINMPGVDGLETLTRIHDLRPALPIVLNSAYGRYSEKFVSWIADAYVTKSSNVGELVGAVRGVLAARALRARGTE